MSPVRILLLEDSDLDAELIDSQLRRGGIAAIMVRTVNREEFVAALERADVDLILSDYQLPGGFDGLSALRIAHGTAPELPFILVSGMLGEELAIEALQEGATDYVLKQRLARLPGAVTRALNEAREREERRRAEARLKLLVGELSHRVKNTLAAVASVARLTLRRSTSLEQFETAFLGRLNALAEAHTLIFQANWGDTELAQVLERTLAPFAKQGGQLRLNGPQLALPPKPALALSLIAHELATNAVKYGALSQEQGCIEIGWTVNDKRDVVLIWKETGGPAVVPPKVKGFGGELIERSVRYELDGKARFTYSPDGLEARLDFPAEWDSQGAFELSVPD